MKLVIFGLTISSSWGNGHATLWRGLLRAFAARGHDVTFYERDVPYYEGHRDLRELPYGNLCLYRDWEGIAAWARGDLADADVAMVTSYCPDGIAATELIGESGPRLRVFYDLDTPVTLDALRTGRPVGYLGSRGLADFDLVLSFTGGRALEDLRTQLGARRVAPLYGSVDPEAHHRTAPMPAFAADLSYLGTYAADRQDALVELFIKPAQRVPEQRFLIGGAMYPDVFPWTDNIYFVRHVEPPHHPAFFSSSRLTLNITRRAMKAMGYCPSGRLFEAAACGTPLLSDAWEGLDTFFAPGREILVAHNADEVIAALRTSDEELAAIAAAARERVLAAHTAADRAGELERRLQEAIGARPDTRAELAGT